MRVVIIYPVPQPLAPANWSGTPHGLASGFAACGVDVAPIGVKLPHGLPVIATSRGGASERIDDGAVAVDPGDSQPLVDAMLAFGDPSMARPTGVAAARSPAKSAWTDVADRIINALGLTRRPAMSLRMGGGTDV